MFESAKHKRKMFQGIEMQQASECQDRVNRIRFLAISTSQTRRPIHCRYLQHEGLDQGEVRQG
jgi:hypothetical protein